MAFATILLVTASDNSPQTKDQRLSCIVSKWRCELVEQGLLPENKKITSVDVEDWTPERRFSVVLETATLSEMGLTDYYRRMGLFVEQAAGTDEPPGALCRSG